MGYFAEIKLNILNQLSEIYLFMNPIWVLVVLCYNESMESEDVAR